MRKSHFYRDIWYAQEVVRALPQLKFLSIKGGGSLLISIPDTTNMQTSEQRGGMPSHLQTVHST